MKCLSWGWVLSLWLRKKIVGQRLSLKHTQHQPDIVLLKI